MWIIDWLPESLKLLSADRLLILGMFIWVFSKVLYFLKIKLYAFFTEIIGLSTVVVSVFLYASVITENKWKDRAQEIKEIVVEITKEVPVINKEVETKFVEKIEFITINTEIIRTEIQTVKEIIDAECRVPNTAIEKYNRAVSDPYLKQALTE